MKIVVIGTRGIPNIQGGVETHCEELYPRLVAMGCDVTLIRRSCYVTDDNRISEYKGVKIIDVYAPRRKSTEAFIHTTLALLKARKLKPDIVHIHAIGPALCTRFAKMIMAPTTTARSGEPWLKRCCAKESAYRHVTPTISLPSAMPLLISSRKVTTDSTTCQSSIME